MVFVWCWSWSCAKAKKSSSKQLEAKVDLVSGVLVRAAGVEGVEGVVMGVEGVAMGVEGVETEVVLAAEAPKRREKVRVRNDILFEV